MSPGTILSDPHFEVEEGLQRRKYFVLLNDGANGHYLTAKITSQGRRYPAVYGCHLLRFPCFHLPVRRCRLPRPSWVQLTAYYPFGAGSIMESIMQGSVHVYDQLDDEITVDLLDCVLRGEDVPEGFRDEMGRVREALDRS